MKDIKVSKSDSQEVWKEAQGVILFGIWRVKTGLLLGGLGLCLLVVGLGFFLYLRSQMKSVVPVQSVDAPRLAEPTTADMHSALVVVLRRHIAAIQRNSLESLAISGTYRTAEIDFNLDVLSKHPALFRQTLDHEKARIVAGFDGAAYWQANPVAQATGDAVAASDVNRDLLILESSLAALAWQFANSGLQGLNLLEPTTLYERPCDVIENRILLDEPVYHYIDQGTGFELRRRVTLMQRKVPLKVTIDYNYDWANQPRNLRDLVGYTVYMNGMQVARADFVSIRPNSGVMPWMFDPR